MALEYSTVISHLSNPRQVRISNYDVLQEEIREIFKDGVVDENEMKVMKQMDMDVREEHQVAQALVAELEGQTPPSPLLPAAKKLVDHLRKCRTFIEDAKQTGAEYNKFSDAEKKRDAERRENKETLELDVTGMGLDLIKSLTSVRARNDVSRETAVKAVARMNPLRVESLKQVLYAAMHALQREDLTASQVNRLLNLGRGR